MASDKETRKRTSGLLAVLMLAGKKRQADAEKNGKAPKKKD